MHALRKLLFGPALMLLTVTAGAADTAPGPSAKKAWHEAIAKGYASLAGRADDFVATTDRYCAGPSATARESVEKAWLNAFLAWQQVRFVDFGPVENDNLAWQFQFWPDPKNLVARKARYLLQAAGSDPAARVSESGVAAQGFPMAEYLLHDDPFNAGEHALPAEETCRLLATVAQRIATNSERLHTDWSRFRQHYLETEQYRDATVRAGMTALEILEERRLAQPMGLRGTGKRSAYAADAWRSGSSLSALEATLEGLQQHYLPGLNMLLESAGQQQLAQRIKDQFGETLANFSRLGSPIQPLLADDRFAELQSLYMDVAQLTMLVNDQAAVALGVVRGFNSSDGD